MTDDRDFHRTHRDAFGHDYRPPSANVWVTVAVLMINFATGVLVGLALALWWTA